VHADATLGGKYRLIRQLDQGGMGSVWEAQHLLLGSSVAVKLMDPQIAASPQAMSRFLREAQSAAALRSPHVVQILDYGIDGGVPYIVMELLEGESLAARLEREPLTARETGRILSDVARALGKAHEAGIAHRDLKPENVFIIRNDDQELAKVLDFGIAKAPRGLAAALAIAPSDETDTGALLGTPNYMSPEQALGSRDLDYRTDIWSLGVIAFECLTGRRPFEAETVGKLLVAICTEPITVPSSVASVPDGFDAWFARACARAADQRFQSAREAMVELRHVCEGEGRSAAPSGASSPAVSMRQRGGESQHPYSLTPTFSSPAPRRSRWLLAVLVLPLTIGVALAIWKRPPAPESVGAMPTVAPKSAASPTPEVERREQAAPAPSPPAVSASAAQPAPAPTSSVRPPPGARPRSTPATRLPVTPARPKKSDDEDLGI
jgi:eukaryotic-like serine/threonine-protein kinase